MHRVSHARTPLAPSPSLAQLPRLGGGARRARQGGEGEAACRGARAVQGGEGAGGEAVRIVGAPGAVDAAAARAAARAEHTAPPPLLSRCLCCAPSPCHPLHLPSAYFTQSQEEGEGGALVRPPVQERRDRQARRWWGRQGRQEEAGRRPRCVIFWDGRGIVTVDDAQPRWTEAPLPPLWTATPDARCPPSHPSAFSLLSTATYCLFSLVSCLLPLLLQRPPAWRTTSAGWA
jgi:hypothetical protein